MADVETLRVIHFDRHRRILGLSEYCGAHDRIVLPIRSVVAEALRLGTTHLLLSHNHPSGDPTPSAADIAATRAFAAVIAGLGIRVHDHIVRGAGTSVSFRALGLL